MMKIFYLNYVCVFHSHVETPVTGYLEKHKRAVADVDDGAL
jgi:hypothetical protein